MTHQSQQDPQDSPPDPERPSEPSHVVKFDWGGWALWLLKGLAICVGILAVLFALGLLLLFGTCMLGGR